MIWKTVTRLSFPRRISHTTHPGKGFRVALTITAFITFVLISLGGVVRVTESGLGCPDWPMCYGEIVPPAEMHALIEFSHRVTASLVACLAVGLAIFAWYKHRSHAVTFPITLALCVLVFQIALGAITVLQELPPTIVTAHLGLAELFWSLLLITLVWSQPVNRVSGSANTIVTRLAVISILGIFLVLLSGSYVVGRGLGAVCPDWPHCADGLIPSSNLLWVHMIHRILAGAIGFLVIATGLVGLKQRHIIPSLGLTSLMVIFVMISQTMIGAANPWFGFSSFVRVAHLSMATALLGTLVVFLGIITNPNSPLRGYK